MLLLTVALLAAAPAPAVARLFPGSKVGARGAEPIVGPIQRNGMWGYAAQIQTASGGGVQWLSFQLYLAKGTRPESPEEAAEQVWGEESVHAVLELVALDRSGRVLGRPDGWPLEAELNLGCMGAACGADRLRANELTAPEPARPRVTVDVLRGGEWRQLSFTVLGGKVRPGPLR